MMDSLRQKEINMYLEALSCILLTVHQLQMLSRERCRTLVFYCTKPIKQLDVVHKQLKITIDGLFDIIHENMNK